jgi:glycosyltransferase involved in cell wall biosynthesis
LSLEISVIIPALDAEAYLPSLLKSIDSQTAPPKEVVVVDSSRSSATTELLRSWKGTVPIIHAHLDFAYPGRARNVGVELATCEWIAFLDCRTSPVEDWLERTTKAANRANASFVPGLCISDADTRFKRALRAASYGNQTWSTVPGSLVHRSAFQQSGGFTGSVRAGEDLEWMDRMRSLGVKSATVEIPTIRYNGFPDSLFSALRKWYVYAIANATIEVRNRHKQIYLILLVVGIILLAFRWNAIFASWDMRSVFYLPNVTKISIAIVFALYMVYRGIIRPRHVKVELSYLLPWRWVAIAFIGLCLDLAKAPGLIWGALLLLKRRLDAARLSSQP